MKKEEKKLREEVVACFDEMAAAWAEKYPELKLKKNDVGVLFEPGVFSLMKEKYNGKEGTKIITEEGSEVSIFDEWKGWKGYSAHGSPCS